MKRKRGGRGTGLGGEGSGGAGGGGGGKAKEYTDKRVKEKEKEKKSGSKRRREDSEEVVQEALGLADSDVGGKAEKNLKKAPVAACQKCKHDRKGLVYCLQRGHITMDE